MVYREAFSPKLDNVAWIKIDGDYYYNTNLKKELGKCNILSGKKLIRATTEEENKCQIS